MKRSKIEYFTAKKVGWAINQFSMIREGDKVLVGVSGGKDSLTLLRMLVTRKRWVPIDYRVKAVHVISDYDPDPEEKKEKLKKYFEDLGCEYLFREIAIKEKNKKGREDCFWCAWNRRKALFRIADEIGYGRVALGHHKDDIAETILMNMIYNGELSSMSPVQELFGGKVTLIRPLVFLEEKDVSRYAKDVGLPIIRSRCPLNNVSKRAVIKNVLSELSSRTRNDIKKNIIRAPHHRKEEYLIDVEEDGRFEPGDFPEDKH